MARTINHHRRRRSNIHVQLASLFIAMAAVSHPPSPSSSSFLCTEAFRLAPLTSRRSLTVRQQNQQQQQQHQRHAQSSSSSSSHSQPPTSRPTTIRQSTLLSASSSSSSTTTTKGRRRRRRQPKLEDSLLEHALLTKEEEQLLARTLQRARTVRTQLDEWRATQEEEQQHPPFLSFHDKDDGSSFDDGWRDRSRVTEKHTLLQQHEEHSDSTRAAMLDEYDYENELNLELSMDDGTDNLYGNDEAEDDFGTFTTTTSSSSSSYSANPSAPLRSDDDVDKLRDLTDADVCAIFNDPAMTTRHHVQTVLLQGARARDQMIRGNLKLVVSIAKRWTHQSMRGSDSFYGLYDGRTDRPSLSEAVQEGVLGLTTAVDRFDHTLNLRLSTYATFYITNMVRQCFRAQHSSALWRLPPLYHDTHAKYRTLVREYYARDGCVPEVRVLAEAMNLQEARLRLILHRTQAWISLDEPVRFNQNGSMGANDNGNVVMDGVASTVEHGNGGGIDALDAEELVELSLLRQSLENAMATELAPHERDVLRLRLGLDDGVARTCRQVATECGGRLTTAQVRQTEQRALTKLRSPVALATYKFLTFVEFAGVDRATMRIR